MFIFSTLRFPYNINLDLVTSGDSRRTACVSRWWAGVDSAWEQEKTRSQKNA
jgi:hypothetical protein